MALFRPELYVDSGYPGDYTCTFKVAFYVESDPGAVTQVIISRNWEGSAVGVVLYYDNTADQMLVVWFTGGGSTFEQATLASRPSISQQCIGYLQSSASTVKGGWAPISSPTSWVSNQTPNPLPAHGSNNWMSLTSNANGAYMTAQNWCGWNEVLSEATLSGEIYSTAIYRTNLVFEIKLNDGDVTDPWADTSGNGNDASQQGGLSPTNRTNFLADYGFGDVGQVLETDVALPIGGTNFAADGDLFIFDDDEGNESSMDGLKLFDGFLAAGSTIAVGIVNETDTAQPITALLARSVAQVSETDTAQAITVRLSRSVAQVAETDTAQPVAARLIRTVAQVSETDSAQPIVARVARGVGQASEADSAQPMVARLVRAVAQVSEADTAQSITLGGTAVAVGQVVETDTAQPITGQLLRAVGQVLETDTAQPAGSSSGVLVAQAVETDAAQPISPRYLSTVAQVLETDTAQALTARHIRTLQQAVETDSAQPIQASVPGQIGTATETDSAQQIVARLIRAIGIVTETDTAQAVTLGSAGGTVGQAQETDTAQSITARLRAAVGQVLEADSALQMRVAIGRAVAQAIETDQALAMAQRQLLQIGMVTEIDTALLITYPGYGDELSEAFRYDVPAGSLHYDIPAGSWRFDVPSIGSDISL